MYLEHLTFVIKRVGWKAFEQKSFFFFLIYFNELKIGTRSKNSIEKDFYKLMNNSNFGHNCWNNLDNCQFVPIFDEYKVTYVGRYFNFFDPRVSQFLTGNLIWQEIEEKYNDRLMKLDKEDKFYPVKLNHLNAEHLSSLEASENLIKKENRQEKTKLGWL